MTPSFRRTRAAATATVVALALAFGACGDGDGSGDGGGSGSGSGDGDRAGNVPALLDLEAPAVDGGTMAFADFAGDQLALWFWAPW